MEKKNITAEPLIRLPEHFQPYQALDTMLGLTRALRLMLSDDSTPESLADIQPELSALAELSERLTNDFHRYFCAIEDITTIRIPRNEKDFERHSIYGKNCVRETGGLYIVNR